MKNRYRIGFWDADSLENAFAYVGSDWNEGIDPWEFGANYNPSEAEPMLRGSVFSDRGVYRLGEEVHFKAVLRQNTATGVRLLPSGTPIVISVRDSENRAVGAWRKSPMSTVQTSPPNRCSSSRAT